jgi:Flp pilus assembly protein TadD
MKSLFYITKKIVVVFAIFICSLSVKAESDSEKVIVSPGIIFQILASELSIISGNVPAAAATYVDIAEKTKDVEAAKRATELSLTLGDHTTALKTAEIWKKSSNNDSDATDAVDALQLVLGKTDELIESMQTRRNAAKNTDTLDIFYNQLASLVKKARDPGIGLVIFEEVSSEDRDLPEVLYTSALLHFSHGDTKKMESLLRKLIDLKPDHANALNALGYSMADRGKNLIEAQRLIKAALIFSPNDPHIVDSMGWLYYRMGDLLKAEEYLSIAFANQPDPEISAHYGEVLWMLSSKEEAISTWRTGFKQNANNQILLETLTRFKISTEELLNDESETVNSL